MAHKTLIGGTAYEISGGKTLVGGTAYSISGGKTLVGGVAYEVSFGKWPDDVDTGLEFTSASAFTISVASPGWDGTMEYCNGDGWKAWDGSAISSGKAKSGQCIYVRGTGNTKVTGATNDNSKVWNLTGSNIQCNGNIENLLDYTTVMSGEHPAMGFTCFGAMFRGRTNLTTAPSLPATTLSVACYSRMFYGCTNLTIAPSLPATKLQTGCYGEMFRDCTSLTTAPSLPATTLASTCYRYMFYGCSNMTTGPSLPATTLAESCYQWMFMGCSSLTTVPYLRATTLPKSCYAYMFSGCQKIKLSGSRTGTYTKAYRIPTSGTGTAEDSSSLNNMFIGTGGTVTSQPVINGTYYLDSSNTIV